MKLKDLVENEDYLYLRDGVFKRVTLLDNPFGQNKEFNKIIYCLLLFRVYPNSELNVMHLYLTEKEVKLHITPLPELWNILYS